jgi:ActR/RegA family two-component response regulator
MTTTVLLVEDNDGDAKLIERKLRKVETSFEVKRVEWLASALQVVATRPPDVALLDLSLPDSQGLDTVVEFVKQAPAIPVVVMTGYDDMKTAMNAVRLGAQDYLIKGQLHDRHLERTLMIAIERHRMDTVERKLMHLSLSQVIGGTEAGGPTVVMLRGHMEKLSEALDALLNYVRKNAPARVDDVTALIESRDIPVVIREIREILDLDQSQRATILPPRKKQSITDMAAEKVEDVVRRHSSDTLRPPDLSSAQQNVLEVIERRFVEHDDDD